jgi:CheY-like chemotaxis protein
VNVLLVEDNEINQLVAENSLRYLGCKVTKADNGHIAIDILAKEKFDIILMDIQMPELDGVEATKILRNKLSLKTPIIALTANAFRTEIDKCMSVGMNDYITKPFNEEELLKIIYKHTKNAIAEHEKDREQKLYNLSSIEELARDDEEFIQKMLSIFITQIQETIPLVDKAFKEKDYAEISRLMHKIKPSIEGFGIYSIKEKVKDLKRMLKKKY